MARKPKDTDYLFISTRLRCLEGSLLSRERMERMLDARTNEEAAKVLMECGYTNLEPLSADALSRSLSAQREETFRELSELSPNPALVDVFRVKYDYHNAKALVKCAAAGTDPHSMLIDAGCCDTSALKSVLSQEDAPQVPTALRDAMLQAQEVLSTTGDPQKSDFILDRTCYEEMLRMSEESRSDFLMGYIRLQIDVLNLRSAVRGIRMKKGMDFMKHVLLPGGNISTDSILALCLSGGSLEGLFTGDLQQAAALGDEATRGGRQTEFEKACDNALNAYLQGCRMIPFGDGVVIAFLAAKENEITAARIIMSGRLSGVKTEAIRERLRDAYV